VSCFQRKPSHSKLENSQSCNPDVFVWSISEHSYSDLAVSKHLHLLGFWIQSSAELQLTDSQAKIKGWARPNHNRSAIKQSGLNLHNRLSITNDCLTVSRVKDLPKRIQSYREKPVWSKLSKLSAETSRSQASMSERSRHEWLEGLAWRRLVIRAEILALPEIYLCCPIKFFGQVICLNSAPEAPEEWHCCPIVALLFEIECKRVVVKAKQSSDHHRCAIAQQITKRCQKLATLKMSNLFVNLQFQLATAELVFDILRINVSKPSTGDRSNSW